MLAPVGNRVCIRRNDEALQAFEGYEAVFVNSGTAALTLALRIAKRQAGEPRTEVIIPAYGCPDLVTACVGAGVTPVLCDIGADDPGFDLEQLQALLSERTLAVIAVNFLGICDRLDEINALATQSGALLIEDDAQWYPEDESLLRGDLVITSFGRGKPASILGGGALLVRDELAHACKDLLSSYRDAAGESPLQRWQYYARIATYNVCLNPSIYGLVARLPGLAIGATVYKPPQPVTAMPAVLRSLLPENIRRYTQGDRVVENHYRQCIDERSGGLVNLPVRLQERAGRLLRYPVLLADKTERDVRLKTLNREGLGASAMYRRPLWEIDGVPPEVMAPAGGAGNASRFADRLLTLPVHEFVRQNEAMRIRDILEVTM